MILSIEDGLRMVREGASNGPTDKHEHPLGPR